ncbi:hypothetical protein Gotri_014549 [Gossypium trilobum]|uniref:DUF4283 domain-containing protein n=1 Tax=Gossypium trilobum TaxID=34281 RepID=A0A7J9DX38_9ROSI|nr:hypothetical protein [Gossypium trilobum]
MLKASFKEMLTSNTKESGGEDVCLDNGETSFLEDDVRVFIEDPYPKINFYERMHGLIDQSMCQTVIIRLLCPAIDYKALVNMIKSVWEVIGDFQIINLDNAYFLIKFSKLEDYEWVFSSGP